jgi:hypothetical protein
MTICVADYTSDFTLQSRDVLLCLGYTGLRSSNFGLQLGDFEHSQGLALMYAVTDVNIDVSDVT